MDGLLCTSQPVTRTLKRSKSVTHSSRCLTDRNCVDCQVLLEHGADVDDLTNIDETPLHLAAFGGNPEVVKVHNYPHWFGFLFTSPATVVS